MSANLVTAYDGMMSATRLLHRVLKVEYPVGAEVSWIRDNRRRHGVVVISPLGDRIVVKSHKTSARYYIRAADIVSSQPSQ